MAERKTKKKDEKLDQNIEQGTTETKLEPASLTMADLQSLSQIVDVASRRGAFQGAELSSVGAVYDKLSAFLKYVAAQQEADKAETEPQANATAD